MLDAGMKSLPALREYNVSPRSGSTTRIPQCAFENSGASVIESMNARSDASRPVLIEPGRGATAAGWRQASRRIETARTRALGIAGGEGRIRENRRSTRDQRILP